MNKIELREDERIDQLYANDIKIIQSSKVFSFSLDAVLLAHFADPTKKENGKIVDLCAGNGAVGLFLTNKTKASIVAVEIQPKLAEMAKRSVELNSLEQQVTVLNLDLNDSLTYLKKDSFDTVTCNPPYFSDLPTSKKNPNPYLALARHEITVTLAQTIEMSSALLKTKGKAYFVHRPDRLFEIFECMQKNRLAPKKVQLVYPKKGREANMVLVEAIKDGRKGGLRFLSPITVYQANDEYTLEMRKILYGTAG
ncbi:tRNA1(Val) (adenine(37)-N6)-methyltransferase [uncultured Ligilactobacillus sp.]|uniref:tRNA1(Val) (adenine(37)-N6)-methyltransferase n=1 Tax=uncultured Ligilactobacillus sp. TaxID=2837633 RepID=UPI002729CCC0|nr:tRNA1(Val) (adenine(37)-N6)-methyltransferase [uncultured Ligilactobacillus sp.]